MDTLWIILGLCIGMLLILSTIVGILWYRLDRLEKKMIYRTHPMVPFQLWIWHCVRKSLKL